MKKVGKEETPMQGCRFERMRSGERLCLVHPHTKNFALADKLDFDGCVELLRRICKNMDTEELLTMLRRWEWTEYAPIALRILNKEKGGKP